MKYYALIKNQKVLTITKMTEDQKSQLESDISFIELDRSQPFPGVGFHYVNEEFIDVEGRSKKLKEIRSMRDEKLVECDNMINELCLGIRNDKDAIKAYRQALLDITNSYKNENGEASESLDSVEVKDIWPAKPIVSK